MSRWIKALVGGVLFTMAVQFCGFVGQCEEVREQIVRVHILAHSDSEEDQALKLKVRDAVVAAGAGILDGISSTQEAKEVLMAALPQLQETAQQCVYDNGYTYPVAATLTTMYFNTRTYDDDTFPAGYYDAVRITIGTGEGKNWWCVMFPPLCVAAATEKQGVEDVLTEEQTHIVQNGTSYQVRFKILEWWEALCSRFQK